MAEKIVSRKAWGATAWASTVNTVSIHEKTNFLVHYHGGPVKVQRGVAVPRNVERIHLANGWAGVGYNFLVDMDGVAYEGRGWTGVGSQCPGYNRTGVGVYVAVGGEQVPTPEAYATVRNLYRDLVNRRDGSSVRKMCHHDGVSTACPGAILHKWRAAGMPYPNSPADAAPAPRPPATLTVDGKYGPATVKARQQSLRTTVDGVVSGQSFWIRDHNPGLDARANWEFVRDPRGSAMVRADQTRLKARGLYTGTVDGLAGPAYWTAVQRELGTTTDGRVSDPSGVVRAIQRAENSGRY